MMVPVDGQENPSPLLEIFEECQISTLSHDRLCIKLKNIYSQNALENRPHQSGAVSETRFTHFADDFFELCRYSLVSSERSPYRERTIDFITKFALFCGKTDEDDVQNTISNRLLSKLFLFCMKHNENLLNQLCKQTSKVSTLHEVFSAPHCIALSNCTMYNECPNPAVRFRSMQIIHKLLDGIGDNGIIADELYSGLQTILLRRVYDIKAFVRVQAIQALSRMQDPVDAECPAVEAFVWLARHDPTAEVRRAALAAMVLTTRTLPSLIERCRDVADSVRRTAYKILAARSVLRPLSIAKRIRVIHDGLSDRSDDVRQASQELVLSWFNATNKDPVMLLRRLDTEGVPETSQLTLDNLFKILPSDELLNTVEQWSQNYLTPERVLKPDHMTTESTFFWRAIVEFAYKKLKHLENLTSTTTNIDNKNTNRKNEIVNDCEKELNEVASPIQKILDLVQPSVSTYVDLAKDLVDKLVQTVLAQEFDEKAMELECVVEQVLCLASSLDLSDEFGRRRLVNLLHDWITSPQVPGTLAPQLLILHGILEPSVRRRVNNVIEMISELCDPVEPLNEINHVKSVENNVSLSNSTSDHAIQNKPQDQENHNQADNIPPNGLSKKNERAIRLKIAGLEVRMNEINEALHNCVKLKQFEQATELRDSCKKLELERAELLQELHGDVAVLREQNIASESSGLNHEHLDTNQNTNILPDDGPDDADGKNAEEEPLGLFERCSAPVLLKANRIAALIIQQSPTLWVLPASLRSLLDSLILPSIQHADPSVRNQAMLALGLCCSLNLPLALQYLPLFYSALRVDHVMISETALRCIIDCLLIYGFRPFDEAKIRLNTRIATDTIVDDEDEDEDETITSAMDFVVLTRQLCQDSTNSADPCAQQPNVLIRRDDMSKTASHLLKPIIALLDRDDENLRTTGALGLAKLLIYDRLISSHILSLLLLLWFNPISEDSPSVRRGLACFFADYACGNTASASGSGSGNYEHQAALTDAVLPTLATLIRAPASSPLSEIEPYDVASLLARLTDTSHLKSQSININIQSDQNDQNKNLTDSENAQQLESNPENNSQKLDNPHHDRLASILSNEILKAPQSAEAKLYLRMLCQLRPSTNNIKVFKDLLILIESISKFADRSTILVLHRFRKQVTEQIEKLGFDVNSLLASPEDSRKENRTEVHSPAKSRLDDDVNDRTLLPDQDIDDATHPALIGSARVNFHLLETEPAPERNLTNTTAIFGQSSRTRSLLGKNMHKNILNFSDDDDDEDSDVTPTGPVNSPPSRTDTSISSPEIKEKESEKEKLSSKTRAVTRKTKTSQPQKRSKGPASNQSFSLRNTRSTTVKRTTQNEKR